MRLSRRKTSEVPSLTAMINSNPPFALDAISISSFGNPGQSLRQAQKCIQRAMDYQIVPGVRTWLHDFLLAYGNRLALPNPLPIDASPLIRSLPRTSFMQNSNLTEKTSVVQEAPDNGKTRVMGMTAFNCLSETRKFSYLTSPSKTVLY